MCLIGSTTTTSGINWSTYIEILLVDNEVMMLQQNNKMHDWNSRIGDMSRITKIIVQTTAMMMMILIIMIVSLLVHVEVVVQVVTVVQQTIIV